MNPSLGRNLEAMDPLEWLARLADHSPDPAKVFQADPIVCKRCGGPARGRCLHHRHRRDPPDLDHLGLSPPEKPPPDVREIVRVPVDDEGRQIGANPA